VAVKENWGKIGLRAPIAFKKIVVWGIVVSTCFGATNPYRPFL